MILEDLIPTSSQKTTHVFHPASSQWLPGHHLSFPCQGLMPLGSGCASLTAPGSIDFTGSLALCSTTDPSPARCTLPAKYTNTKDKARSRCPVTHSSGLCMELAEQWKGLGILEMRRSKRKTWICCERADKLCIEYWTPVYVWPLMSRQW